MPPCSAGFSRRAGALWALAVVAAGFVAAATAAGCAPPPAVLRPPENVASVTVDQTPPQPTEPPPVPANMQPFDRPWLYFVFPRTLAVQDAFHDDTSNSFTVALAAAAPDGRPAEPPRIRARLILLPGFPADNLDSALNAGRALHVTPGDLFSRVFTGRRFDDLTTTSLEHPPGTLSQVWRIDGAEATGRISGFIARSGNTAAWVFCLCEPAPDAADLRNALLAGLVPRLGADLQFDDLATDWRIDTVLPPGWAEPGPSQYSRRWDAPGHQAFFVITNGQPRGARTFLTCGPQDAAAALRRFPEVKAQPDVKIAAAASFLTDLYATCGAAQTVVPTQPLATTLGAWVFYDPIARKTVSVYYAYRTPDQKKAIDMMLKHLHRVAILPAPPAPSATPATPPANPPEFSAP
ncbi:MAG: hypothetical protein ACREJ2_10395 [Planctomycetota bacterium]